MKVKYTGEVDGKTVEGKTTINVFQSLIETFKVKPSKGISVDYGLRDAPKIISFYGRVAVHSIFLLSGTKSVF